MKLKFRTLLLTPRGLITACGDDDGNRPSRRGRARVVHASPDAEAGGEVPYLTASNYLDVPAGDQNLNVNVAAGPLSGIDADASLVDGIDYKVIASGLADATERVVRGSQ